MLENRPFFRFHPGAYDRVFEPSDAVCVICEAPCVWRYTGSIYLARKPDPVCARCIATGRIEAFAPGQFGQLHDADIAGASAKLVQEVLQRTPGFDTYNPFEWPVVDGEPLAFIGHGDDPAVWKDPAVQAAINAMFNEAGWDHGDGPSPYALVFRSLRTGAFVAVMDLD
ncbi:CbrC family protein [Hyphomonas sp.]|uniref:CbrC family protein n=1 Tax=Hyphomonas sp. TaxID=87 RepID=UPI003918C526